MKYLLALLFVLVQVAGEGFRLQLLPFSLIQFFLVLVLVASVLIVRVGCTRFDGTIDRSILVFALSLVLAWAIGWNRGAGWSNIKNDLSPFFSLMASYVATRLIVRSTSSMRTVIGGILLGSALAAFKLMFVIMSSTVVEWSGPWQATRDKSFGMVRVILQGADIFFVVSTIMVFTLWVTTRKVDRWKLVTGMLAVVGVFVAGTRSNWVGLGVGFFVAILTMGLFSRIWLSRVFRVGMIGATLMVIVFASSESFRMLVNRVGESTLKRIDPITIRLYESEGVLTAIGEAVMFGNGMGATYDYYDMFSKKMMTEPFSHNGYLMLLLKTGILGLLLFLLVVYRVMRLAFRLVRAGHPWRGELIGLVGALVAVLVLSIGVNKIFALSGAMFMGTAFAIVQTANIVSGGSLGKPCHERVGQ